MCSCVEGTGFGLRDLTPEAIAPLLQRQAPGVVHAMYEAGLKHTPLAVLSRPVAGTRGATLIVTLPGSVKAVTENMTALVPLLPRIVNLLQGNAC
jgi:gephyrin